MLILHQIQKPFHEAVKDLNATGLSNLVFQIIPEVDWTTFVFKDNGYPQACHIHIKLGRREPSISEWVGQ
jgi:hypothetical protein